MFELRRSPLAVIFVRPLYNVVRVKISDDLFMILNELTLFFLILCNVALSREG